MDAAPFFDFARERHAIYLRRKAGVPRFDWTVDPILQANRFTNVFRELDKTTIWLREHVRGPLRDDPRVMMGVVLFRWFNRIETGEAIFTQKRLGGGTAWDEFLRTWNTDVLQESIRAYCGKGPYVTGAYIIKSPAGVDKLVGVLRSVSRFVDYCGGDPIGIATRLADKQRTLQSVWEWFRKADHLGDFMAYEIVSDLRWTYILENAPDILTWANPGPGAIRGLNRMMGRPLESRATGGLFLPEMMTLLHMSRDPKYWPQDDPAQWPAWELRDVEHTLCEFDKYERMRQGEGQMKAKFR